MAEPRVKAGGGLAAVVYTINKGREAGGVVELYRRLRSNNACKTCAVGMGGRAGGMVNEAGQFPEVCKKSVQAQAGDMAGPIDEAFFRDTPISRIETMRSVDLQALGRLAFPIIAEPGDEHFRRLSWQDGIERVARALVEADPNETFFYSSGRSSNEAAFLLQLVARAYGTNNINNCSYYCHQASGVALPMVYGSGTSSITLEDLDRTDLAVVVGANPASNHPRLITKLVELRRRGGKVIIVNPLRELGLERFRVPSRWRSMLFGSQVSDLYLQPHIGGDVAVFKALLKAVIEAGAAESGFIESSTTGWPEVVADAAASDWDTLVHASGLTRTQIEQAARVIAGAERGVVMWAMGITHHSNGVDNVLALANLALSRGWLGGHGRGLLPIRGHSNVQGVGSCGVAPRLKEAFAARLLALYGVEVPSAEGLDTFASMEAASKGRIKVAFLLGGNLFSANPDRSWAGAALGRIGMTVSVSTHLNEGHVQGRGAVSIILPALARDEENQSTTQESMFNFVRVSQGGNPAVAGEMRSEVDIIASLAQRILPPRRFEWDSMRSHRRLREEIGKCVDGYANIADIDDSGREFQIQGRTFHDPVFATTSGRAAFHVTPLPEFGADADSFRLMTLRSEGQFNSVVYEDEDLYRGNTSRDVVMMSCEDAVRLHLEEGARVVVGSEVGSLEARVSIKDIRTGNLAMYYPEANILVPRDIDPRSRTPAFKSVPVRLRRLHEKS